MRFGQSKCALIIALLLFPAAPVMRAAHAQEPDACDRLAGNLDDPEKVVPGIEALVMDAPAALVACRTATDKHPGVLRFHYQLALALVRSKQPVEAEAEMSLAAEQGYVAAQSDLGLLYRGSNGFKRDLSASIHWSTLAAQQGLSTAMTDLGVDYARGLGVSRDYTQALEWYQRAVALGDRYALKYLGDLYKNGQGVAQSDDEAVRLYRLSAERGYRAGQTALGLMYLAGRGVPQDRSRAIELFKLAAAREETEAIRMLRQLSEPTPDPSSVKQE